MTAKKMDISDKTKTLIEDLSNIEPDAVLLTENRWEDIKALIERGQKLSKLVGLIAADFSGDLRLSMSLIHGQVFNAVGELSNQVKPSIIDGASSRKLTFVKNRLFDFVDVMKRTSRRLNDMAKRSSQDPMAFSGEVTTALNVCADLASYLEFTGETISRRVKSQIGLLKEEGR